MYVLPKLSKKNHKNHQIPKCIDYKYQKSVASTVCTHHTTQIKLKQHYRNSYAASASLMKRKASNSAYSHQDQTTKQPYAT
jgi:hypothetical protein